jgi:hypothetical protein
MEEEKPQGAHARAPASKVSTSTASVAMPGMGSGGVTALRTLAKLA